MSFARPEPSYLSASPESPARSYAVEILQVRVDELNEEDSPRLEGVDPGHVSVLAEHWESLPPILVHRQTMNVIDGLHRVRVARQLGSPYIIAQFFDGSAEEAFQLSVESNVMHGLPLTLADRKAAAARIIRSDPTVSDRSVAVITGMATRSVAAVRRHLTDIEVSERRMGRDGKLRPLSAAEGRRLASQAIAARPEAPLREIARQAGVSVSTAHDVRARLQSGKDPVPIRRRKAVVGSAGPESEAKVGTLLDGLRQDPSLRYSESGRTLLRWLADKTVDPGQSREITQGMPAHCAVLVARIAHECARTWNELAVDMERLTADCA